MPRLFPPSLPAEIGRPLLAAAHHVFKRAPWEFMSDLELLGLRDDATGELYVASILGTPRLRKHWNLPDYHNAATSSLK